MVDGMGSLFLSSGTVILGYQSRDFCSVNLSDALALDLRKMVGVLDSLVGS